MHDKNEDEWLGPLKFMEIIVLGMLSVVVAVMFAFALQGGCGKNKTSEDVCLDRLLTIMRNIPAVQADLLQRTLVATKKRSGGEMCELLALAEAIMNGKKGIEHSDGISAPTGTAGPRKDAQGGD